MGNSNGCGAAGLFLILLAIIDGRRFVVAQVAHNELGEIERQLLNLLLVLSRSGERHLRHHQ